VCVDQDETGRYDFSELEQRIERLAHYGLRVEPLVVHGTPAWAGSGGEEETEETDWRSQRRPFAEPADWADYETFVFELVSRFRDRIRVWEVMNEPNTPDSGLQGGPAIYRKYLRVFHRAAKRADPNCTVLCGRVGLDWLKAMVRDDPNILRCLDGIAMHPYTSNGSGSFAQARREQLWLAARGTPKPVHITEVGFFGGVWHDPRPGAEVTREMGEKVAHGLPLMARLSGDITWWNSSFASYAHGLLRHEGHCLRPLDQYRAFGKMTGCLVYGEAPVTATVDAPADPLKPGEQVVLTLRAENRSDRSQPIRFWPVGFVKRLGCDLEGNRNHEWAGVLQPGQVHTASIPVIPAQEMAERVFSVGLGIVCDGGNALALAEVTVGAATAQRALPAAENRTIDFFPPDSFLRGFLVSPPRIAREIPLEQFTRLNAVKPTGEERFWTLSQWHCVESLAETHRQPGTGGDAVWDNRFMRLRVADDENGVPALDMTIDSLAIYNHSNLSLKGEMK
jgi:hypothetical protein